MNNNKFDLKGMRAAIEKIEQHAMELNALGTGIPAVEKNARIIMSIVDNLKFGIVDPAVLMDQ